MPNLPTDSSKKLPKEEGKGQKEKENLFSVRGFETETSNFAPNGCLRVSINWKFDARSNGMLRMIPRPL